MNPRNEELTAQLIAAAIELHRTLGPGFLLNFAEAGLRIKRVRKAA